ncbi:MAG: S-methyl-5-thioribose-1-phosphate isomerase [Candidatus Omnitrophica bacterium]|nr:S-methyl-5-thioribose-1-phosphate isomerase [Candidatus Omnitrophota bacterium]HOX53938.1 S-methyl-5-thioribose-1-phosphate isomerase [Candidatus Omnitrophota bacterium]
MPIPTIEFKNNSIKIIDQTKLPTRYNFIYCKNIQALWKAIRTMQVRGAPALGVAAAFGAYLGIKDFKGNNNQFLKKVKSVIKYLGSSRPTAINLFWALERIQKLAIKNKNKPIKEIKALILKEAKKVFEEDRVISRKMGEYGQPLIKNNDRILTICNAGALATADYGTALALFYKAKEKGKHIKVFACETRPLLQGARLTTWELKKHKIDTTLICDNMAASLMAKGKIDKVITGADRIASNGDAANKIGTYSLAVLAKYHKIPFYIVAPISSFDLKLKTGKGIPIEQRNPNEVTIINNKRIAAKNIKVYNPAFDVTPHELITAIVTENGIIRPPFSRNIQKVL